MTGIDRGIIKRYFQKVIQFGVVGVSLAISTVGVKADVSSTSVSQSTRIVQVSNKSLAATTSYQQNTDSATCLVDSDNSVGQEGIKRSPSTTEHIESVSTSESANQEVSDKTSKVSQNDGYVNSNNISSINESSDAKVEVPANELKNKLQIVDNNTKQSTSSVNAPLADQTQAKTKTFEDSGLNISPQAKNNQTYDNNLHANGPAQHVNEEIQVNKQMGLVVCRWLGKPIYSLPGSMNDAKAYGWTDNYRTIDGRSAGQMISEDVNVVAEYRNNDTTWALFTNSKGEAYWIDEQYLGGLIVQNGPAQHVNGENEVNKVMYLKVIQLSGKPLYSLPGSLQNSQEFGWTDEYKTADGKLSVSLPTSPVTVLAEYKDGESTWALFSILGNSSYWIDEQYLDPIQIANGPAQHVNGEIQVNKQMGLVVCRWLGKPIYSLPGSMNDAKAYGWTDNYRTTDGRSAGQMISEDVNVVAEYRNNDTTWALFTNSKGEAYWIDEQYLGGLIVQNGPAQHVNGENEVNKVMYLKVIQLSGKPLYSLPGSLQNSQEFGWTDEYKTADGKLSISLPSEIVTVLAEYKDGKSTWALFSILGNAAYWIDEQYLESVQSTDGPGEIMVGANQVKKIAFLFVIRYENHSLYTLPAHLTGSRLLGWTDDINGQSLPSGETVDVIEEFVNETTTWALFIFPTGTSYWIDEQYLTFPDIYFDGRDARTYRFYAIKDTINKDGLYDIPSYNQPNTDARTYDRSIVFSDMEVNTPYGNFYVHINLNGSWHWIESADLSCEQSTSGQRVSPIALSNCYNVYGQVIYNGSTKYSSELDSAAEALNTMLGEKVFIRADRFVPNSSVTLDVVDDPNTTSMSYMGTNSSAGKMYVNTAIIGQGNTADSVVIEKIFEHELCHAIGLNHTGARINNKLVAWSWSDDSDLMFSESNTPPSTHFLTNADLAALKLVRNLGMYYDLSHPEVGSVKAIQK